MSDSLRVKSNKVDCMETQNRLRNCNVDFRYSNIESDGCELKLGFELKRYGSSQIVRTSM
jgi:hypothetical protein